MAKRARENMELAKTDEERQLNELYMQMEQEGLSGGISYDAIAKLVEFKKQIASAITDMGIQTAANADASTMSSNIRYLTGASSADKVSYDNTNSGLTATNVQGAVDEVNDNLDEQPTFIYDEKGKITGYKTKIGGADTVFPFNSIQNTTDLGLPFFARNQHVFPITGYSTVKFICSSSYQSNYTWGFSVIGWKKDELTSLPNWTFKSDFTIDSTNGTILFSKANPGSSFLNKEVTVDISGYDYIVFASNGWGGNYWLYV